MVRDISASTYMFTDYGLRNLPLDVTLFGIRGKPGIDYTSQLQQAFDTADSLKRPLYFPPGSYLTDTIDYRMQSIIGEDAASTFIIGKPGKDIFNVNATLGQFYRTFGTFHDITFVLDDTVDVSANFPNRGGVGNACYALDYPDKLAPSPPSAIGWSYFNLFFTTITGNVIGGQNNSCGIYTQNNHFTQFYFWNWEFSYLKYGWRDHYPVQNFTPYVTSFSRDHPNGNTLHFLRCGYQWTTYGWGNGAVKNIMFHGGPSIVDLDCDWNYMEISAVEMVGNSPSQNFITSVRNHKNSYKQISISSNVQIVWNEDDSEYYGNFNVPTISFPWLLINGSRNVFEISETGPTAAQYGYDFVDDRGVGNQVFQGERSSSTNLYRRMAGVRDNRIARQRDAGALLLGIDPPYVSNQDLLINPRLLRLNSGGPPNPTAFDWIYDTSVDPFGVYFRRIPAGGAITLDTNNLNEIDGFHVGNFLPTGKVRVYIKHRAATGGTLTWTLQGPIGTTRGNIVNSVIATAPAWNTIFFDADLSAVLSSDSMRLVSGAVGGGGTGPIDIAYIMFRPWAKTWPVELEGVSTDNGDSAKTLTHGIDTEIQRWNTPLAANRAVTLTVPAGPANGVHFHIVREAGATGASVLNVGTGPLKALAVSQWCDVHFDGVAWRLTRFGAL